MKFNIPEEFERSSGIYIIRNSINDKVYVGSALNFKNRFSVHRAELKSQRHHSPRLQNFFNKYGGESLSFHILIVCQYERESIIRREQHFIDLLDSSNPLRGFNISEKAGVRSLPNPKHGKTECKNCKSIFKRKVKGRPYCSQKCYFEYKSAHLQEVNCLSCKTSFRQNNVSRKYCSQECANKGNIKSERKNLICPTCNKPFTSIKKDGRFKIHCSAKCLIKIKVKQCVVCNNDFKQNKSKQITCGRSCAIIFKQQQRKQVVKLIHCNQCNKEFTPNNTKTKFCSRVCGAKSRAKEIPYRKQRLDKVCILCNKKFAVRIDHDRETCSAKCTLQLKRPKKLSNCLKCNTLFSPKYRGERLQQYCSKTCADSLRTADPSRLWVERTFTCLCCSKSVTTTHASKKYCSKSCSEKYSRSNPELVTRKSWNKRPPVNCPTCNKSFYREDNQTYCSQTCYHQSRRKTRLTPEPVPSKNGQYLIPFAA